MNGRFRSTDILGEMGGALGEFGPITVESTNNRILSAVSEVTSSLGPGGFFPGVNVATAWQTGFMSEVIDTGNYGDAGNLPYQRWVQHRRWHSCERDGYLSQQRRDTGWGSPRLRRPRERNDAA